MELLMVEEMKLESITCYACHKELDIEAKAKIHKSSECDFCYADLRCCKMCELYSPTSYNECRETGADRIIEKEKANFCDFYVLKGRAEDKNKVKNDLDSVANALFKD